MAGEEAKGLLKKIEVTTVFFFCCLLLPVGLLVSLQDTKTSMINSVISVVFNILFDLILVKFMAHDGLALATLLLYGLKNCLYFYWNFILSIE